MSDKKIKINPEFFSIKNRKNNNTRKNTSNTNPDKDKNNSNKAAYSIKKTLLSKLKDYNTNKELNKKEDVPQYAPNNEVENSMAFLEKLSISKSKAKSINQPQDSNLVKENRLQNQNLPKPILKESAINTDSANNSQHKKDEIPYGCLKNGTKPTYRSWQSTTIKHNPDRSNTLHTKMVKYKLGKQGKKIAVLIKDSKTRKKISNECNQIKKTDILIMKQYLRRHNLLKAGSSAPNDIIKKLYQQSLLAGDVRNNNSENILHNYAAQ